jgi:hypothetical protein
MILDKRPLPKHTKAQSWHTQSELDTFRAQAGNRPFSGFVELGLKDALILVP